MVVDQVSLQLQYDEISRELNLSDYARWPPFKSLLAMAASELFPLRKIPTFSGSVPILSIE
jgi:hypothetical protein